jgi:hypothetical protein
MASNGLQTRVVIETGGYCPECKNFIVFSRTAATILANSLEGKRMMCPECPQLNYLVVRNGEVVLT